MKVYPATIEGLWVVEPELQRDQRGFFARTWCSEILASYGISTGIVQCNISFNASRGTMRGMHYQAAPFGEAKLVRCTMGRIFDVALDVRPNSPTLHQWFAIELSAANRCALFIPEGFAHGFVTLTDDAEVFYQMTTAYRPTAARRLNCFDPEFSIEWPITNVRMSDADRNCPLFAGSPNDQHLSEPYLHR